MFKLYVKKLYFVCITILNLIKDVIKDVKCTSIYKLKLLI